MKGKKLTVILIVVICVLVLAIVIALLVNAADRRREERYETLVAQAADLFLDGDYDAALKLYEEGTDLAPGRSEAWWGLASVYNEQGDVQAAVEVLYQATRSVKSQADREELTETMNLLEDSLRYDKNNPPSASGSETAREPDVPAFSEDDGTEEDAGKEPEKEDGTQEPEENPDGDDEPADGSDEPEEPEGDGEPDAPADVTGIKVNRQLLDNVLSMKHSELVETYGAATATNTDWGVMVTYQRCHVSFFYGYSFDGLVDPETSIPYDYAFPNSAAFGTDAGLITGQSGNSLTMEQLALLFGTEPVCVYNDMDQVWNVSVPYGTASLLFLSDEEGNVDLTDMIWIYHLNDN